MNELCKDKSSIFSDNAVIHRHSDNNAIVFQCDRSQCMLKASRGLCLSQAVIIA